LFEKIVTPAKCGVQSWGPGLRRDDRASIIVARIFLATIMLFGPGGCGFQLRGEPEVGIKKLFISSVGPSLVMADIRRTLAIGPTRLVGAAADADAHLHILQETREKTVFTITGTGRVYEFQLRLLVRYELLVPGREEPVIPSTEVETRRLITYSETAPTAKESEEALLFKDMQLDLARQVLRHVAAMKREI
jgi:LPS-assembly lipoprotein